VEYSDTLPPCKRLDFGTRIVIHLCAYCAYILVLQLFLLLDSGKVSIPGNKPYSLMHVHTHIYIMTYVTSQFLYKNLGLNNHCTGLCSYSLIQWWALAILSDHADKLLDANFFFGGGIFSIPVSMVKITLLNTVHATACDQFK
jgi:hypothetical protein